MLLSWLCTSTWLEKMPAKGWKTKTRTKIPDTTGALLAAAEGSSARPQATERPRHLHPWGEPDPQGRRSCIMVAQSHQWDPGIGCAGTPALGSWEPDLGCPPATEQLTQGCSTLPTRLQHGQQPAAGTSMPCMQWHRCLQTRLADRGSNCTKDNSRGRGPGPPPQPPSPVKHPQRFPSHLQQAERYSGGHHHV